MRALVDDLRAEVAKVTEGGGDEGARTGISAAASCCRATGCSGLLDPGSPFLELSQLAAHGVYGEPIPAAGLITGIGRVAGRECMIVANDATVKGGTYYPADGEEAPAGAGDRTREQPALHLSGRQRRRQPAEPGRGLPRPRAFRPHLLQPGDHVGARHPADRGGDGILHRRRRLRAGDVRRGDHRPEPGHDLPRRPAAGEGRDRRGGRRPRTWAAPTSIPAPRASPTTTRTTTRMRWRWPGASSPT